MKLFCTAALQKKLGWSCEKAPTPSDPLDYWYATLISLHGADTVVAILPAFRFCIILWDIQESSCANLNEVLVYSIRYALDNPFYNIPRSLIDKYLPEDTVLEPCATSDRSMISKTTPVTAKIIESDNPTLWEILNRSPKVFNPADTQNLVNKTDFPAKDCGDRIVPWRALKAHLQQTYGKAAPAMDLDITLDLQQHVVRRTLRVAADVPFAFLGGYISTALCWSYSGAHQFSLMSKEGWDGPLFFLGRDIDRSNMCPIGYAFDDEEARLSEFLSEGDSLVYYFYPKDADDPWEINIRVSRCIPSTEEDLPVCTLCEGKAPPEWVDGAAGYRKFCEIISNPKDPRYEEMRRAGKNWLQEDTAEAITAYLPFEE